MPDRTYEDVAWSHGAFDEVDAPGARFLACTFEAVTVTGGRWERSLWRGGALDGVRCRGCPDGADPVARGGPDGVRPVGVRAARVVAAAGAGSTGCLLDVVNLRGAVLDEVVFEDCRLREVDLGGAQLTGVSFAGCRIERLDLTGATLTEVDLRGAVALDVARGLDRLGGAVLDVGQVLELAPALAAQLGVDVRYPQA